MGGIIFMPPDRNFGGIFSIISLLEKVMMESYEVGESVRGGTQLWHELGKVERGREWILFQCRGAGHNFISFLLLA